MEHLLPDYSTIGRSVKAEVCRTRIFSLRISGGVLAVDGLIGTFLTDDREEHCTHKPNFIGAELWGILASVTEVYPAQHAVGRHVADTVRYPPRKVASSRRQKIPVN